MIKYACILLACCFWHPLTALAQARRSVHGTLVDAQTGAFVQGAIVSIPNVGKGVTSDIGEFYIEVTYHPNCRPGAPLSLNINHPDYGYDLVQRTIDTNYGLSTIHIQKSYQKVLGVVKNRDGSFIEGIQVTCQLGIPGFQEPVVTTDEFGRFTFILNQRLIGRIHSFDMFFRDPNGLYADQNVSRSIDRQLSVEVYLDRTRLPESPTPSDVWPYSLSKPALEEKIRLILHNNGQLRGGSRVHSATVDDRSVNGRSVVFRGTYQAVNYGWPYAGDFKCTYNPSSNKIEQIEFKNVADRAWTPVSAHLLEK